MLKQLIRVVTVAVLISGAHASEIGVSPSRLELQLSPGTTATETINLVSNANKTEHISVRIVDWTLSPTGKVQFLPGGSVQHSSRAWLHPEATAVDIPPGSSVPFRVSVAVPSGADLQGTYHAMVVFDVGAYAPSTKSNIQMTVTTAIGVAVYVSISGTQRPQARLADMYRGDDGSVVLVLSNGGNTLLRVSGQLEFRDQNGQTVDTASVEDAPVLRGSERELHVAVPTSLGPGYYVVLALLHDRGGGVLSGQVPIQVK